MSNAPGTVDAMYADNDRPLAELLDAYGRGADVLAAAIEGMSRDDLLAYPVPGKLSTQRVVCHIADADQFMADRMKRTISVDRPLLVGVDGIGYLEALAYDERDLSLDIAQVRATRAQMLADLRRLPDEAWQRQAVHTEVGLVTLRQLLVHAIDHLVDHVATIHAKRTVLGV